MSGGVLLQGALTLQLSPPRVERLDVRVEDGRIAGTGPALTARPGDQIEDLAGFWLMPGMVCAHTHLYSALSCGMPMPAREPASFAHMLAEVWWRLDRALDLDAVEVSALVGGVAALRAGVTTVVDHHASPDAIDGSLEVIDGALDRIGLRRLLCYEVTDRGGPARAQAGLDAHRALLAAGSEGGTRAVLVGGHANFTLSDATLRAMGALAREAGVGLHIHVAEARDDEARAGEPLVARLQRLDALPPGSVLAHCVHLSHEELQRVADAGAWVTHQPRSNMNNAVGYANLASFGARTALGTDGIGADMLAELQAGWFRSREGGVGWSPARWMEALAAGATLAGDALGTPLGTIEAGAAADLVALDPVPGPPLDAASLPAALIFRLSSAAVRHVMVGGRWRLWNRAPTGLDAAALDDRARLAARDLWARMTTLPEQLP